ncbi:MAG: RHS repeat-associated core domain-containing protein, partial [Actinomycetota bacterium]|nr:RHS repeat-associated core domain-containing protein [Actinomycetota bacterium]
YYYNPAKSLVRMDDKRFEDSAQGRVDRSRTTYMTYDREERRTRVNEAWTQGKDSTYAFDVDGNTIRRQTDGEWEAAQNGEPGRITSAKEARFEFDALGRETKMVVEPEGQANARVTWTEQYPSGQNERRVLRRSVPKADASAVAQCGTSGQPACDDTERWYHERDGRLARLERTGRDGTETQSQSYAYDRNGNRSSDERGTHTFNARDELTQWTRKGSQETVDYVLDGAGSILSETSSTGATKTYDYADGGEQLESVTGPEGTSRYTYNPWGDVESISGGGSDARFGYDEFDRMTCSAGGASLPATCDDAAGKRSIQYDGLDRRDSMTENGESTDFSYIGTSENLSQEEGTNKTRAYDYSSDFERLGMDRSDASGSASSSYSSYLKDANGSVTGMTGDGGAKLPDANYRYTPYGELEDPNALAEEGADNPFRFQGFYYDSGVKTYDMKARAYRPEIGRFLTQDRYESAAQDFNLQSDPLTQNRYAFAGGNPVNRIEFDGHDFFDDFKEGVSDAAGAVGDFAKGFGKAAWETGESVVSTVKWANDSGYINPTKWITDPKGTLEQNKKNFQVASAIAENPGGFAKGAWESIKAPYTDPNTSVAEKAGRATFDIGSIFAGGVGGATKGAKVASTAARATSHLSTAGTVGRLGRVASRLRRAPDCNSFAPGTLVSLADGRRIPIR